MYQKLLRPEDYRDYHNDYFKYFSIAQHDRAKHQRASSIAALMEQNKGTSLSLKDISKTKLAQEDFDIYYEMKNL